MPVRFLQANTMTVVTSMFFFLNQFLSLCPLEKTGCSDSESFGGSSESLSSPGKNKFKFFSVTNFWHANQNCVTFSSVLHIFFSLWKCTQHTGGSPKHYLL